MLPSLTLEKTNKHKVLVALFIIAVIAAAALLYAEQIQEIISVLRDRDKIANFAGELGAWGPIFIGGSIIFQILVAVIPGHPLFFASGYLYGFFNGFLLSWVFIVLATQITFLIARRGGRQLVWKLADNNKVSLWLRSSQINSIGFYLLAFNIPMFPSDILGYVAGLSNISPRKFFLINLFGRIPVPLLLAYLGHYSINPSEVSFPSVIVFIVLALAVWVLHKRTQKLSNPIVLRASNEEK